MDECGVALLLLVRQRHPGLDPEQALPGPLALRACALRMHDAAAGPHPVDRTWLDGLLGAETVAVQDLAFEQVSDRRQVDVRVGTDVDALVGQELGRAHLVEEDERPDHLALDRGQGAANLHLAKVHRTRHDQYLDGLRASRGRRERGRGRGSSSCVILQKGERRLWASRGRAKIVIHGPRFCSRTAHRSVDASAWCFHAAWPWAHRKALLQDCRRGLPLLSRHLLGFYDCCGDQRNSAQLTEQTDPKAQRHGRAFGSLRNVPARSQGGPPNAGRSAGSRSSGRSDPAGTGTAGSSRCSC